MEKTEETVHRPGETSALRIRLSADRPDSTAVLRLTGAITAATSRILDHYLTTEVPSHSAHVAVELSEVTLLSADGIRVLTEHARRLISADRRLSIVAPNQQLLKSLELSEVSDMPGIYDSVSLAAIDRVSIPAQPTATSAPDQDGELLTLLDQVFHLRAVLHLQPIIAQAVGMMQGRYRIDNSARAFGLLDDSARKHHLTVQDMARAVLSVPAPASTTFWFPHRRRRPEPLLTFYLRPAGHHGNYIATLSSFLSKALEYLHTTMGALHIAEAPGDRSHLAQQQGLPNGLAHHLAEPNEGHQPALAAQSRRTRIVVPDTAVDSLVPAETQQLLARSGIHALQCTPVITTDGQCAGTVTTYHQDRGHVPAVLECAKLGHAATELADWLEWHEKTVMLDALEHLHQHASVTR